MTSDPLSSLRTEITSCTQCPRLIAHCKEVSRVKRKSYHDQTYWGKPVGSFGPISARLMIVGLAPAAHGANRTGRIFTGDRSGDWLYRALHKQGFASQPTATGLADGLKLKDAVVTCAVHCAPPNNRPHPLEIKNCSSYLAREIEIFSSVQVYLALGALALNSLWPQLGPPRGHRKKPNFTHGGEFKLGQGRLLLMSYHPSQQNTFTGRLTEPMFDAIFTRARVWILKTASA